MRIKKFESYSTNESSNVESLKDALSELMDSKFVDIIENRDRINNKSIFHVAVGSPSKILIFVKLDNFDRSQNSCALLFKDGFRSDIKRLKTIQKGEDIKLNSYLNGDHDKHFKSRLKKSFDEMVEIYDLIEEGLIRSQIEYNDISYFLEDSDSINYKWHRGLGSDFRNNDRIALHDIYFMVFIIDC